MVENYIYIYKVLKNSRVCIASNCYAWFAALTKVKTMWKSSNGILHFCTSESLTICFFSVNEVDVVHMVSTKDLTKQNTSGSGTTRWLTYPNLLLLLPMAM